jgi:hypothetical protein
MGVEGVHENGSTDARNGPDKVDISQKAQRHNRTSAA